jgi:hypothetical protein
MSQEFVRRLRRAFTNQRCSARRRSIGFELTFNQWLSLWLASGKLQQRGVHKDQYVMARPGDRGSYAEGNIVFILATQNSSEGNRGKVLSPETLRRMSIAQMGHPVSAATRRKLANAHKGVPISAEHRARITQTHKARAQTPEGKAHLDRMRMCRVQSAIGAARRFGLQVEARL